jgi:tetratricopeptide (TPR) repeat protein
MPLSRFLSFLIGSFFRHVISFTAILFIFFTISNPINVRAQFEKRTYPNDLAKSSSLVEKNEIFSNRYARLVKSAWRDDCKSSSLNWSISRNNYGIYFLTLGEYEEASTYFNKAKLKVESKGLQFETEILDFHLGIAAIGISNGKNSKNSPVSQTNYFDLISPLKFDNYGLNYYKGFQSMDVQNFSNAKQYFLLDIQNGNDYVGRSNFALAYSLYHLGNYKASLGLLDSSTYTLRSENNLIRGNIYLKNKSYREAIDNYDKLQSAGEEKSTFVVPKVRDGVLIPPKPGTGVTFYYDFLGKISKVYTLIEKGEYKRAEKLLSQNFEKVESNKYPYHYANALVKYKSENWKEAAKAFREVLDKNPVLAHAYLGSALCNYRIGNKLQTKIDLDKAVGMDNKLWAAREARALYFFSEHDQVNAMQDIDFILQANQEYEFSYDALISRGFYYLQNKEKSSFEEIQTKLLKSYPNQSGTFMLKGLSLEHFEKKKLLAKDEFEMAVKMEDSVSNHWANLANICYTLSYGICNEEIKKEDKIKFGEKAKKSFQKAIKLDPTNVYAWNGLSMCFLEENMLDSARYYVNSAIDNFEKSADLSKDHSKKEFSSLLMNAQYVTITNAQKLFQLGFSRDSLNSLMSEAWRHAQRGMKYHTDTIEYYINQGLGWQQLRDSSLMNKYYSAAIGTNSEFIAHNNWGVNFKIQYSDDSKAKEEWDTAYDQTFEEGLKRLIDNNRKGSQELNNIYYYLPVMDWRPLEIKVKVELPVLYFDPPLPLVVGPFLSVMPEETICRQLVNEEPLPKNFNTDKSDTVKPCVAVKKKNKRRK